MARLAGSMHGSQTRLTFADNGQSLFEILDANRDGQLSIRELRNAWNARSRSTPRSRAALRVARFHGNIN